MKILNPAFDRSTFFARVEEAGRRALLLDYDGTLSPFTPDRERARPYPGVREALADLARDGRTRLAVVSGRSLADLAGLVAMPVELWGSHGLEHVSGTGRYEAAPIPPGVARLVDAASRWIRHRGWGALLETKPFGLALHARAQPDLFGRAAPEVLARWSGPAQTEGLEIRAFDAGVELRPLQRGKGQVVERVLAEEGPEVPTAYLGDDETDEDAFAAIRGRGLGVLVQSRARPTKADAWLSPPAELLAFLGEWSGSRPNGRGASWD